LALFDARGYVSSTLSGLTTAAIVALLGGSTGVAILTFVLGYFVLLSTADAWLRWSLSGAFVSFFMVVWLVLFIFVERRVRSKTPPPAPVGDTRSPTVRRAQDEPANRLEWVTCSNCGHSFRVSVPSNASSVELAAVALRMDFLVEYRCPCPSCGAQWWVRATVLFH